MRDMARRPEKDRADLFRATAQAMRVHEAIIEKDFWVCWILDYLFQDSPWKAHMAFKGGTSLSFTPALVRTYFLAATMTGGPTMQYTGATTSGEASRSFVRTAAGYHRNGLAPVKAGRSSASLP